VPVAAACGAWRSRVTRPYPGIAQVFEKGNFAGLEAMKRSERLFARVAPMGVADIAMAVRYEHVPRPPLAGVLLTAFDGLADATIERGNMAQWGRYTGGAFRHVPIVGDHYFVTTHFREARPRSCLSVQGNDFGEGTDSRC
jgi:surfactin synthase thioesterase subunit